MDEYQKDETTIILNMKNCKNPIKTRKEINRISALKTRTSVALVSQGLWGWIKGFFIQKTARVDQIKWFESGKEAAKWASDKAAR